MFFESLRVSRTREIASDFKCSCYKISKISITVQFTQNKSIVRDILQKQNLQLTQDSRKRFKIFLGTHFNKKTVPLVYFKLFCNFLINLIGPSNLINIKK